MGSLQNAETPNLLQPQLGISFDNCVLRLTASDVMPIPNLCPVLTRWIGLRWKHKPHSTVAGK